MTLEPKTRGISGSSRNILRTHWTGFAHSGEEDVLKPAVRRGTRARHTQSEVRMTSVTCVD